MSSTKLNEAVDKKTSERPVADLAVDTKDFEDPNAGSNEGEGGQKGGVKPIDPTLLPIGDPAGAA